MVLGAEEQAAYQKCYAAAVKEWEKLRLAGYSVAAKHMLQAMSMLLPLRRICSGGRVPLSSLSVREISVNAKTGELEMKSSDQAAPSDVECCICLDNLERPVVRQRRLIAAAGGGGVCVRVGGGGGGGGAVSAWAAWRELYVVSWKLWGGSGACGGCALLPPLTTTHPPAHPKTMSACPCR